MKNLCVALFLALPLITFGQYRDLSSQQVASYIDETVDSSNISAALELAERLQRIEKYDSATYWIDRAEAWMVEISDLSRLQLAHLRRGVHYEFAVGSFDSARTEYVQCIDLSRKNHDIKSQIRGLRNLGIASGRNGDTTAMDSIMKEAASVALKNKRYAQFFDVLEIHAIGWYMNGGEKHATEIIDTIKAYAKRSTDERIRGLALNEVGNYSWSVGNLPAVVLHYLQSLEIWKARQHNYRMWDAYSTLGNVFDEMGEFDRAAFYQEEAIACLKSMPSHPELANSYNTLGWFYYHLGDSAKALEAIQISEYLYTKYHPDDPQIAFPVGNMGLIMTSQGLFDSAIVFSRRAVKLFDVYNYPSGIAEAYNNIGIAYIGLKNLDSALFYLNKGLEIALDVGDPMEERNAQEGLAQIFKSKGQFKDALAAYERFTYLNDSIYDDEAKTKSNRYQQQLSEERDAAIIRSLEAESELNKARIRQQQIIGIGGIVFILFILAFLIQIYRIWKARKKAYEKLEQKHRELEASQKTILEQKDQIGDQKAQIEQQHNDIIDSINFASRIQQALLKPEEHINQALPPHFIFYKPRDIVSGDCYWAAHDHPYLYISAIDCTGHGVPGAMMSMLGIAFLNEIMASKQHIEPAELLDHLRDKVIKELGQEKDTSTSSYREGMDLALVRLNLETKELVFAGANNPLWLFRDGEVKIVKGSKQGISYSERMEPFTQENIVLQPGDTFYIFSDGYPDQLGGPKGKKLKSTVFRDFLLSIHEHDLNRQKELLDQHFLNWMGDMEQVDDVCVIGMRV